MIAHCVDMPNRPLPEGEEAAASGRRPPPLSIPQYTARDCHYAAEDKHVRSSRGGERKNGGREGERDGGKSQEGETMNDRRNIPNDKSERKNTFKGNEQTDQLLVENILAKSVVYSSELQIFIDRS